MFTRASKISLVSLSIVSTLISIEVFLRFWKRDVAYLPHPNLILSLRPKIASPILSYETYENLNGLSFRRADTPRQIGIDRTNNVGFRMSEDIYEKSKGEKRVLLLGDSYTEGNSVSEPDRFFHLTEQRLKAIDSNWRVLNAGIQSASPAQYVLQARQFLAQFQPDYLIVVLQPNDLWDDMYFEKIHGFNYDASGLPESLKSTWKLKLLRLSYLFRYLDSILPKRLRSNEDGPRPIAWQKLLCDKHEPTYEAFRQKTGRYLAGLKVMAERQGAKFGVLVGHYPYIFENEAYDELRFPYLKENLASFGCEKGKSPYPAFIASFLTSQAISFADTLHAFQKAKVESPKRKLFNFYDYHYSPFGNQVVANELFRLLVALD